MRASPSGRAVAVDTSALIAILQGEPEAAQFLDVLDAAKPALVGMPTVFETWIVLRGHEAEAALAALDALCQAANVAMVAFGQDHLRWAQLAFDRYGKGRHPAALNYGDCMAYAVARHHDAPLLYKGGDFGRTDVTTHSASADLTSADWEKG